MRCDEAKGKLRFYADGGTKGLEAFRLRFHLWTCSSCRSDLHAIQRANARVNEALRQERDFADVSEVVMAMINAEPARYYRRLRKALAVGLAMTCVAASIVVAVVWKQPAKEPPMHIVKITQPKVMPTEQLQKEPEEDFTSPHSNERINKPMPIIPKKHAKKYTKDDPDISSPPSNHEPMPEESEPVFTEHEPVNEEAHILVVTAREYDDQPYLEVQTTNAVTGSRSYYNSSNAQQIDNEEATTL